ncbi:YidC/Oxa1 family membrane protein insertase [Balneicella halophila]|uniref:Membrane protein insertase YidC n=1 Tax=Balneicella halophila TaxID=1537566 RepID=A0A7L4US36_BALHA|nr:membrane protein insertase YidC [Balneicella halophila]PVX52595.1 YidC/Oxa1 family membrane protein insertase [Balneicella halophila]
MDRNSIIGFILIGILIVAYTFYNQPTEEELQQIKRKQDSIAQVEKLVKEQEIKQEESSFQVVGEVASSTSTASVAESFTTLENNLLKLKLSNHGGKIASVELKKYKSYDDSPLILWEGKGNNFGLQIGQQGNILSTQSLVFESARTTDSTVVMTAQTPMGGKIDYIYSLSKDNYSVGFDVKLNNLKSSLGAPEKINLVWSEDLIANEKGRRFENRYTSVYYKKVDGDVKHLSSSADTDTEEPEDALRWVAFKSQFFSSVLITNESFSNVKMETNSYAETSPYLKRTAVNIPLNYKGTNDTSFDLRFYFGPNEYKTLRKYGKDIELHKLIDLGWGPIAWVNRFLVIEIFNFLEKYITSNYGIIILLLTIIIKLLLAPLTYKSYVSSAKMRVLKPQIEEINERIPKDKAMERQQATMELYRKAGVNPMGGCIPMIVQMPILFAMFYFFPVAIQLRQKSFLWAEDLSSYDSIASLPFNIPFYGDHVSLFCLLMAVTNLIYTYINMQNQPSTSQPGMPNMKFIMYLMPIIFLGVFNQYASGLSYYYFVATLFTIIQTIIIRKFMIDDEKLLARLEENKAKTKKKPKSKFRQRLEEMQKEQMRQQKKKKK